MPESSVWILIAVNLIPAIGVLAWNWDLYSVMVLFWMETAIIGFYQIIKIFRTMLILSFFLVPFFCVHFGAFMFGHFIFLTAFFGPDGLKHMPNPLPVLMDLLFNRGFWVPALALFLSHGFAFFKYDWNPESAVPAETTPTPAPEKKDDYHPMDDWQSELKPVSAKINNTPINLSPRLQALLMWVAKRSVNPGRQDLMAEPYKRVVVMHITIILGAFLTFIVGKSKWVILLLIGLKIASDLISHVHYHGLGKKGQVPAGIVQH